MIVDKIMQPVRLALTILALGAVLPLTAQAAVASDGSGTEIKTSPAESESRPRRVFESTAAQPDCGLDNNRIIARVSSHAFSSAMTLQCGLDGESRSGDPIVTPTPTATKPDVKLTGGVFAAPRVSTAPMTAGEKFKYAMEGALKPPGPYALSIFSGLFNELLDKNDGRDSSVGDYFADSMTRAARSQATRVANNFFEKFFYATVFKQDPRYHRSQSRSAGGKIKHAISRLFVTQGDRSGEQFNASYLIGGLSAAALSNYWQREEKRTVGHTLRRWSTHLWLTAGSNILREFLSGQ